jgi:hypothetical protein
MSNWHSNPLRVIALMTETTPEERESLTTPILAKDDAIWAAEPGDTERRDRRANPEVN